MNSLEKVGLDPYFAGIPIRCIIIGVNTMHPP